jgi:hypothetical protein
VTGYRPVTLAACKIDSCTRKLKGTIVPIRSQTDPRAVFILTLCVVTGFPLIFAGVQPGSFEELLPSIIVRLWGISLVVGCLVTLAGMSHRRTLTGVLLEQVGSVAVGAVSIFYATAVMIVAGWDGAVPAGFIIGWAFSCFYRYWQLEHSIRLEATKRGAEIVVQKIQEDIHAENREIN